MMMNCESFTNFFRSSVKRADVRLVERRVDFVQEAEGRGLDEVEREEERNGGQGALPAGQEADPLQLGAGRLGDDLDAALEDVVPLDELDVGAAAAEERLEGVLEVLADLLEGDLELLLGRDC
jgi:hypothetical protein